MKSISSVQYRLILSALFFIVVLSSCGENSQLGEATPTTKPSPSSTVALIPTPTVKPLPSPSSGVVPTPTVTVAPSPTVPPSSPSPTPTIISGPSPTSTTAPGSAATMALNYYQALKNQSYTEAYTYLDPNAIDTTTGQKLTQSLFTQLAQNSDSAGGAISSFSAAAYPPLVVMTVSRSGGPYHVHLEVKLEGGLWKITSLDRI